MTPLSGVFCCLDLVCKLFFCYTAEVKERITFDQVKESAKNPGSVTPAEWKTGMAVTEALFAEGTPIDLVEDNILVPKKPVPNKYDVGSKTTVEFMPHWGYAAIEKGEKRVLFELKSSRLPTEEVVKNVKNKIREMKQLEN